MHRTASLVLVSSAVAVRFAPVFPPDDAVPVPLQVQPAVQVHHGMQPDVQVHHVKGSQDQCVEHLVFQGGQTHAYSNLGGLGPHTSKPAEMRFRNIGWDHNNGAEMDLVLINETVYKTSAWQDNGVKPGTNVGEITVAMGTDVVMNMSFVEHDTSNLVYLDRAKLTICDVDHHDIDSPEIYTLDVDAFYIVPEGLDFTYKFMDLSGSVLGASAMKNETVSALEAGRFVKKIFQDSGEKFRVQVTSGALGFLCDNPTDFDHLTNITFKDTPACQGGYYNDHQDLVVDQAKRCFAIELVGSASTRFVFQAGMPLTSPHRVDSGHNRRAFISGASTYFNEVAPCPTPPTPPPTPEPTQAAIECEPLSTLDENNFNDRGNSVLDASSTYTYTLANGYSVALTGWTHTRSYATGFLRNLHGTATAIVSGLQPGEVYKFKVYQRSTKKNHEYTNGLSVNGITLAPTTSSASKEATSEGEAVATGQGEITFTFTRTAQQVHLSGLAIGLCQAATTSVAPELTTSDGGGDHDECDSAKCEVVRYLVDSVSNILNRLNLTCGGRLNLTSGFWHRRAALGA